MCTERDWKGEREAFVCLGKCLFITFSGIWSNFCFTLNISLHSVTGSHLAWASWGKFWEFCQTTTQSFIFMLWKPAVSSQTASFLSWSNFQKQITALFSTVNHTLHPFNVIDKSKAEHASHVQMENIGLSASCCEILKHRVTALTTKEKWRNIQRGKKKDSEWRKTKEGEVQKAAGPNVLCMPKTSVLLNTSWSQQYSLITATTDWAFAVCKAWAD